jgi:hypothetical protein
MKQITQQEFDKALSNNPRMTVKQEIVGQASWDTYSGRGVKGKVQVLYVKRNYRNQITFFQNDCNDDGVL